MYALHAIVREYLFFLEVDFTSVNFYVFPLHYTVLKFDSGNTQNKIYLLNNVWTSK